MNFSVSKSCKVAPKKVTPQNHLSVIQWPILLSPKITALGFGAIVSWDENTIFASDKSDISQVVAAEVDPVGETKLVVVTSKTISKKGLKRSIYNSHLPGVVRSGRISNGLNPIVLLVACWSELPASIAVLMTWLFIISIARSFARKPIRWM